MYPRTIAMLVCWSAICTTRSLTADDSSGELFFESKIRPLLLSRCTECHGDSAPEGELSLTSRDGLLSGGSLGPAIVPGKPKESLLISAINHDAFLKMPPKDKLPTSELVLLSKWVSMGAPWPSTDRTNADSKNAKGDGESDESLVKAESLDKKVDLVEFTEEQKAFWSYQRLRQPSPPVTDQDEWSQSPIDKFILEKLQAKGLQPAMRASKTDLIRRATYDLVGLPPTLDEFDAFLRDDSPTAFSAVIDRLLASPRYGEKWGRHWLDVARFADSNGLDENIAYANAFRYRDYVISSLNRDTPYDRFVQEQIAGDLLESDSVESPDDSQARFAATGFLAIGAKMLAEDDPVKMQMDIIDEQLSTVCQAFMGMTIGCARCHDHKFDPIPTADYYALAGIFKSTQTMENHKVVAKWFERPLASPSEMELMRKVDDEIAAVNLTIAKFNESCRARLAKSIQNSIANGLMTLARYDDFNTAARLKLARGFDHNDRAYPVNAGYALIEAEGFHRGNVSRETDNYGKEIGVIISMEGAHAEYDIVAEHAGRYAIEFRYAAAESRPIRLLLDGREVSSSILAETTGSWQPNSQDWFVSDQLDLSPGKHTLRLETKKTFPHIDKFAIVFQSDAAWPFDAEPVCLSRIGYDSSVDYQVVALWRNYFAITRKRLSKDPTGQSFFAPWLRACEYKDRDTSLQQVYKELQDDTLLRKQTPPMVGEALLSARPDSLSEVAGLMEALAQRIVSTDGNTNEESVKLREELLNEASPLSGPKNDIAKFYSAEEKTLATKLEADLAEIKVRRPSPPMAMGVTEAKPEDLRIHLRGSHLVFGKLAKRRFPQILTNANATPIPESSSGRLELAQWMTRPDHPLTSRVIVNRVWHWHFKRGIVSSVDNFGLLGQKPTHPELLDWLASHFVANGWSLKHLHRTIMLSQTYQMGSQISEKGTEIDPANELRWQFQRRRLTGEEIRDSIIDIGAGLDTIMYGTLMKVPNHTYVNSTGAGGVLNYANARRSVYLPVIRSGVFEVLQTLDFPDPAMSNGERQTSTAAPQALLMMNSDLVHEQTLSIAKRLIQASMDDGQRILAAYQQILKRHATAVEMRTTATYVQNARDRAAIAASDGTSTEEQRELALWQGLCRVLISSNEFSYVE